MPFKFWLNLLIIISSLVLYIFVSKYYNIMPPKPKLNVQNFPRPPLLEKTPRHLLVKHQGHTIADTKDAYWVLETYHSPTYYLPKSCLALPLKTTTKSTFCEYKGWATYYSISLPSDNQGDEVELPNRIWSYETPTEKYKDIKGYVSFYAGPWECFVDGEEVKPQPGDFYGGWTTSELEGIIKGSAETRWM